MELLDLIHKSLFPIYKLYANSQGEIEIDRFLKFSKDFALFPDLILKSKLITIFSSLSSLYQITLEEKQEKKTNQTKILKDFLDHNLFIEAIALCACDLNVEDCNNDFEKVNFYKKFI